MLVLGAGASIPYGYPSGRELAQRISRTGWAAESAEMQVLGRLGFSAAQVKSFQSEFRRADMSIDEFLNAQQHFGKLGKALLAMHIISYEASDRLTSPERSHWYRFLWDVIRQHLGKLDECNIRILTFNYDRSLEKYLVDAIGAFCGCDADMALELIKPLGIAHVYGDVGALGELDLPKGTRPYQPSSTDLSHVSVAQLRLRLMGERKHDGEPDEVKKYLQWAHVVCFLGFGYDPLNLMRLGLSRRNPDGKQAQSDPRVFYGTLFGLADAERKRVASTFDHFVFASAFMHDDCEAYLRNTGILGLRVGL